LDTLESALTAKAAEFRDIVKSGRTHLMDAVPVTLGQEFAGYAAQIRLGAERVRNALPHVAQIPLGGTATGTGLNTHPEFAERVRAILKDDTGLDIRPPEDPFEANGNRTAGTVGGLEGNFELNVRVPLIARNVLESIQLLTAKANLFAEKCVDGIEANLEGCQRSAESTLAVATALNPYIGYDKGTEI